MGLLLPGASCQSTETEGRQTLGCQSWQAVHTVSAVRVLFSIRRTLLSTDWTEQKDPGAASGFRLTFDPGTSCLLEKSNSTCKRRQDQALIIRESQVYGQWSEREQGRDEMRRESILENHWKGCWSCNVRSPVIIPLLLCSHLLLIQDSLGSENSSVARLAEFSLHQGEHKGQCAFRSLGNVGRKQCSKGHDLLIGRGLPLSAGEGKTRNLEKKEVTYFVSQTKNTGHQFQQVSNLHLLTKDKTEPEMTTDQRISVM